MIYTMEVEKELRDFEFQGKVEYIACAVDCFKNLDEWDPWEFLDAVIQDLEVEERRNFTEREINEFMHNAIPILLRHGFEPYDKEEVACLCDKANCSVRLLLWL